MILITTVIIATVISLSTTIIPFKLNYAAAGIIGVGANTTGSDIEANNDFNTSKL